jgi:hypothetical protein
MTTKQKRTFSNNPMTAVQYNTMVPGFQHPIVNEHPRAHFVLAPSISCIVHEGGEQKLQKILVLSTEKC